MAQKKIALSTRLSVLHHAPNTARSRADTRTLREWSCMHVTRASLDTDTSWSPATKRWKGRRPHFFVWFIAWKATWLISCPPAVYTPTRESGVTCTIYSSFSKSVCTRFEVLSTRLSVLLHHAPNTARSRADTRTLREWSFMHVTCFTWHWYFMITCKETVKREETSLFCVIHCLKSNMAHFLSTSCLHADSWFKCYLHSFAQFIQASPSLSAPAGKLWKLSHLSHIRGFAHVSVRS